MKVQAQHKLQQTHRQSKISNKHQTESCKELQEPPAAVMDLHGNLQSHYVNSPISNCNTHNCSINISHQTTCGALGSSQQQQW